MGLDTTHDCWHGPYSAFKRFREEVAAAAKEHYGYEPDYDAHPFRAFMGWWDFPHEYEREADWHEPSDILDVFFVHSDCDGWIFPCHAGVLADKLDVLVGYLDDETLAYHNLTSRAALKQFVKGLHKACDNGEVVGFH